MLVSWCKVDSDVTALSFDGTHDVIVTFPANPNIDYCSGQSLDGCIDCEISGLFFRTFLTMVVCWANSSSADVNKLSQRKFHSLRSHGPVVVTTAVEHTFVSEITNGTIGNMLDDYVYKKLYLISGKFKFFSKYVYVKTQL